MDANEPSVPWRRYLTGAGLGVLAPLVALLLSLGPSVTERVVANGFAPWVAWLLSRLTGWIPLAVVEVLLLLLIGRQFQLVGRGVRALARRRVQGRRTLAGLARLAHDAGWVVLVFYLAWGFQYSRPPLETRWGWPAEDPPIHTTEVETLARILVDEANLAYLALHGTDDLGAPTPRPNSDRLLNDRLEVAWQALATELELPRARRYRHGPVKRPWVSPLLARMGISGVYSPWTGEANVNATIPAARLAQTMGHEKAHQRGFASENEANFLGYLAAVRTADPLARYGGLLFAQRQLLRTLQRTDSARALPLIRARHPGVQRDVDDIVAYWARYRGQLQRLASRTNDIYLKGQGVADGRRSYARSVELLIRYARQNDGSPLPR